jgi:hypothetical protein
MSRHGSRSRYRKGCHCVACCRSNSKTLDRPVELRWPVKFLTKRHDPELVQEKINEVLDNPLSLKEYRAVGLPDFDADKVAIALGDHPMHVWPGWLEAGEDFYDG